MPSLSHIIRITNAAINRRRIAHQTATTRLQFVRFRTAISRLVGNCSSVLTQQTFNLKTMFFSADWQPWRIDHGDFNMAVVLATGNELPRNGPRTMRNFLRLFLQFRWRPITRNSNMARLGLVIVPLCNLCHGTAAQAPPFQKIERCPVHKLLLIAQPLKHPTSDSKYGHPSLSLRKYD